MLLAISSAAGAGGLDKSEGKMNVAIYKDILYDNCSRVVWTSSQ